MKQDYLFLVGFSRAIAIAIGKTSNLDHMKWFSHLLNETLNTEMKLHVDYCKEVGISREALLTTQSTPATHAYTRHLLETAYTGTALDTAVALLPCCWSYAEIGRRLTIVQVQNNQPHLSKWIEMYSSDEFWQLSIDLRSFIDIQTETLDGNRHSDLIDTFVKSTHYECRFWNAAYILEDW